MNDLSDRLRAVINEVRCKGTAADIGCDHALTDIFLVKKGICRNAIAMDVRREPLKRAEKNIKDLGLEDRIEVRLSDGFERLLPGEAETAVITGMGGKLMRNILSAYPEKTASLKELVLSPQSDIPLIRRFLSESEFVTDREIMVKDCGKYYNIIHAFNRSLKKAGTRKYTSETDMIYGRYLIMSRDRVFLEYVAHEREKKINILRSLSGVSSEAGMKRKDELEKDIRTSDIILSDRYAELLDQGS